MDRSHHTHTTHTVTTIGWLSHSLTHHHPRRSHHYQVAAAQLSHRYIADRFLPDKAIDLVDEAAAKLNIEVGVYVYMYDCCLLFGLAYV